MTFAQAFDRQAPLRTKVIRSRPLVPWFHEEIKAAKREKRKAERKWCRTGSRKDMLAYKAKKNNANALMMKLDAHSIMNSLRIIVEICAVSFRQRRSSSVRRTTGMCTPLWVITSNWRTKWGLSLFTKSRPLVPSSTTWLRGYHPLLMTTTQHDLVRSANSTSFQRRLANSSAAVQRKVAL